MVSLNWARIIKVKLPNGEKKQIMHDMPDHKEGVNFVFKCLLDPEIGAIKDKSSATVATWFHETITCRYGPPARVRSDQGTEFKGMFKTYLDSIGCK